MRRCNYGFVAIRIITILSARRLGSEIPSTYKVGFIGWISLNIFHKQQMNKKDVSEGVLCLRLFFSKSILQIYKESSPAFSTRLSSKYGKSPLRIRWETGTTRKFQKGLGKGFYSHNGD